MLTKIWLSLKTWDYSLALLLTKILALLVLNLKTERPWELRTATSAHPPPLLHNIRVYMYMVMDLRFNITSEMKTTLDLWKIILGNIFSFTQLIKTGPLGDS